MDDTEQLKELRAYKIGYDLGWYRAHEALAGQLSEVTDAITNSATFQQIEREGGSKPIFLAKILDIQLQIVEMRNENLPTLLLERQKITELASKIASLPDGVFTGELSIGSTNMLEDRTASNSQIEGSKSDE
jgi:hypothetical protein